MKLLNLYKYVGGQQISQINDKSSTWKTLSPSFFYNLDKI